MTGNHAENRILFFNCKFFKFGTDDKVYAAAIILSMILLASLMLLCIMITVRDNKELGNIAILLINVFVDTSGYALGRASLGSNVQNPNSLE